jgi:hypothetical protein
MVVSDRRLIVTFGGIFITSALIGVLASSLEGRLGDLRRDAHE